MPAMTGGVIGTSPLGSADLSDVSSNAQSPIFLMRIQAAAAIVAQEVQAESTSTTNDTFRRLLAARVAASPHLMTGAIALAVLADLTTLTNASDQALLTRVEAVWDTVAGTG
jgi:delta 1-pyrroline-5-carboxylate dehydrogenase